MQTRFFNPHDDVRITGHNLPHWQQSGGTYFVTFRLADSLPASLLQEWQVERDAWLHMRPSPLSAEDEQAYHRLFSTRIDHWLDAGHGACALRHTVAQDCVVDALRHFEGVRYRLWSWVIMPNHMHVCFSLHEAWSLEQVVFTWKRRTAGEINRARGTSGTVWQRDYFDRLVRDAEHFAGVRRYIRSNPERAKLRAGEFARWECARLQEGAEAGEP